MFTEIVLDHFRNPRNPGDLPSATVVVDVSNPVCCDLLRLAVRVENDRVAEARFLCRGCTTAIASASLVTEKIKGHPIVHASSLTAQKISEELGGLPAASFHGAELAAAAVTALLAKLASHQR